METLRSYGLALGALVFVGFLFFTLSPSDSESSYESFTPRPDHQLTFAVNQTKSTLTINSKSLRAVDLYGKVHHGKKVRGLPRVYLREEGRDRLLGKFRYG
ncbi:MAG: hypothetical protein ACYTGH_12555 [Planctomycetota bacterium]|jgi:hypothetical protein